jgi:hypothetical protein
MRESTKREQQMIDAVLAHARVATFEGALEDVTYMTLPGFDPARIDDLTCGIVIGECLAPPQSQGNAWIFHDRRLAPRHGDLVAFDLQSQSINVGRTLRTTKLLHRTYGAWQLTGRDATFDVCALFDDDVQPFATAVLYVKFGPSWRATPARPAPDPWPQLGIERLPAITILPFEPPNDGNFVTARMFGVDKLPAHPREAVSDFHEFTGV